MFDRIRLTGRPGRAICLCQVARPLRLIHPATEGARGPLPRDGRDETGPSRCFRGRPHRSRF